MGEVLGGLGLFGMLIFLLLGSILPISAYAAQKGACKCFKELEKLNQKNGSLIIEIGLLTKSLSNPRLNKDAA